MAHIPRVQFTILSDPLDDGILKPRIAALLRQYADAIFQGTDETKPFEHDGLTMTVATSLTPMEQIAKELVESAECLQFGRSLVASVDVHELKKLADALGVELWPTKD